VPFLCLVCQNIIIQNVIYTHKLHSTRSFQRTVDGPDITFDMESKLPKLNNLAAHVPECKGAKDDKKKEELTSEDQINIKCSAELMEAYLKEGELNPEVVATYKGFLHIFLAWIFDESLPWTTGEAPTLQMLFKYLKITYQLPSDMTVCNQLAHIFEELHGKVVRDFAVGTPFHKQLFYHSSHSSRKSSPRLHMQLIHGLHHRWCILSPARLGVSSMMTGKSLRV
jgi:hypothetical protein